ncbi:uncharacterized protein LOC108682624 isoform X2 [Hyalella azteca]|uniref:Uncharacterized protein LOC108682624 isoform X1 n=1 Tax=Hyalella azteca TaxID=294128 RepID=A0A8B7PPU0_HYAAZ|nr:uncharacterized protein LOC108682624 isoform X1 [Hyalella azteca]XP_018027317.1 uncharacterized protein LOC108682624 isoform X2 [Hyalella azteca]
MTVNTEEDETKSEGGNENSSSSSKLPSSVEPHAIASSDTREDSPRSRKSRHDNDSRKSSTSSGSQDELSNSVVPLEFSSPVVSAIDTPEIDTLSAAGTTDTPVDATTLTHSVKPNSDSITQKISPKCDVSNEARIISDAVLASENPVSNSPATQDAGGKSDTIAVPIANSLSLNNHPKPEDVVRNRSSNSTPAALSAETDGLEDTMKPKRIFQRPPEGEYVTAGEEEMDETPAPPDQVLPLDGGWGWMVVLGSFMIHVFADGFTYTLGIFYVYLLSYYSATKASAAWIVSILVGVTMGSGPISGALVNKFGCRVVTIMGAVLASIMLFVSIFATNIYTLYFTIGIGAGLGFGLIYLPAIVCVTQYFEKKRSFATGIAVCGSGLGTFVFSPLVEYLIVTYNWKGALVIISGLMLNCIVFGAFFRPLEDNYPRRRPVPAPSAPDATSRPLLPKLQVSQTLEALPESPSNVSLAQKILGFRRRNSKLLRPFSVPNDEADMMRIKSHGCLNPTIQSLRQSEALRMTVSQPLFAEVEAGDRIPDRSAASRPLSAQSHILDRKDIFYRGSLYNIPEYKQDPQCYRESVVRHHDVECVVQKQQRKACGCVPCSEEACSALSDLTDLGLLADPVFLLFAASNFLTSIGFYAPYIFIVDRALEIGIVAEKTATLLAVVGISNTVSRVVLGYVADRPWVNRLYVYNSALTICGLATCLSIWMNSFGGQCFYAVMFGGTSGAYVGLTSVVLVDLLGMEKLTNAFGLVLMFQGIAAVVGPPMCGSLFDLSQNYNNTFLLAGAMIAASGVMLFFTPCVQRFKQRRQRAPADHDCTCDLPAHSV